MATVHKSICYIFFITSILLYAGCEDENQAWTLIQGSVLSMEGHKQVHSAFLIIGNELLASTREDGSFEIDSHDPGLHSILCSSLGFRDTLIQIEVKEGALTELDFFLSADDSHGRVYGELHDQTLYNAQLAGNPSIAGWNGKELFDGISGATIQTMTFGSDLPSAEIYVGDSLIALTDGFGQYWVDLQAGTYPLHVSLSGYRDTIQIIQVKPDSDIFANFILSQQ